MLSYFKDFLDFFYSNHQLMWDNIILFAIWGVMCTSVGYSLALKRIRHLKERIHIVEIENKSMKQLYPQLTLEERLMMGEKEPELSPSADAISRKIQKK